MKIRVKNRKTFLRYAWGFIAFIVLAVAVTVVLLLPKNKTAKEDPAPKPPETVNVEASIQGDNLAEKGAEDTIKAYFKAYYTSLGTLTDGDMSSLFDTSEPAGAEAAALDNAALNYLIACRKLYPGIVAFKDVDYTLSFYKDKADENGLLTVVLYLNEACEFTHTPGVTSYMCHMEHTFTLKKTDEVYKIVSHKADGTLNILIENYTALIDSQRTYTAEETAALVAEAAGKMTDRADTNLTGYYKDLNDYNTNPSGYTYTDAQNAYDRIKAVNYANTWVGETSVLRNTAKWAAYDTYGGNCTNYVSQCLFEGGIPMDLSGDYIWKWYSDTPDNTGEAAGRCPSWTAVGSMYSYCENNSGYGLSAKVGGNFYSGKPGDLIVMGTGKDYSHIVIITSVVTDKDGKVVDYLINSNTSDRKSYPLAAYGHNNMRLIHINGWSSK